MRIWFDTEFIEDGRTIELLSIGMVREDGWRLYAEPREADRERACPWVRANVLPKLTGPTRWRDEIAAEVVAFAGEAPEFWAYYGAYDWVALCQLFGRMVDLPAGWPMFCRDIKQLAVELGDPPLPEQNDSFAHNALDDAFWTMHAHHVLEGVKRDRGEDV